MRFRNLWFGALLTIIVSSCTTEIKIARTLNRDKSTISVLCDFPDYIILTNSMVEVPKDLSGKELADFYDTLFVHSEYVQYVNDTLFFHEFQENMKMQMLRIGVKYYESDDIDGFLSSKGTQYIINFKQLEMEERWEAFHDEEHIGDMLYEEDFWIKGVSLNAWMDIAKVNDTVEIQRQLYYESVIKDDVDGMFFQNQWNGDVHYQYRLDSLKVSDIDDLQYQAADEFTYFILDYIFNKEIRDRLNYAEGLEPINSWNLSPTSRRLIPGDKKE